MYISLSEHEHQARVPVVGRRERRRQVRQAARATQGEHSGRDRRRLRLSHSITHWHYQVTDHATPFP